MRVLHLELHDGHPHTSPLPGFAGVSDIVIASRNGRELYVFDSRGKQKSTVDAMVRDDQNPPQPVVHYAFDYDTGGRLASVTDANGNTTQITRTTTEVTLTAPHNRVTTITLDGNGYIASITNPDNDITQFDHSDTGLLSSITDAENHTTLFTYDGNGRLITALYPQVSPTPPAGDTLTRTTVPVTNGTGYKVTHTSGQGVETGYQVEDLPDGRTVRTTLFPDQTTETRIINIDGSEYLTQPTDVQQDRITGPDPRFGMQAPVDQTSHVAIPGTPPDNLTATVTQSRTANLSNPDDPFSFTTHTETVTVNGRPVTRTYTAATRTYTDTSPEGRSTTTLLDANNRPTQQQVGNLTATAFGYDGEGRLDTVTQGSRSTTIAYDTAGNVETVTDPANRTVSFTYDDAGRVKTQTLPDTRVITFDYDQNGNVTGITPPHHFLHEFSYSPSNQPTFYFPPDVPSAVPPLVDAHTEYQYNLSGQLTRILRPDAKTVFLDYDLETGNLITQVLPTGQGQRDFTYFDLTGNLERITFPGGTLTYAYDGNLLKQEAWGGTVTGTVDRTYDNSFRVKQLSVNGANPVEFTYDADDLLQAVDNDPSTGPDDMILTRNPSTGFGAGLLTDTELGVVTDHYGYNAFGAVTSYSASVSGTPIFEVSYTRDDLGRIESKTETIDGTGPDTYVYGYDAAGRLTDVAKNSLPVAHYEYDANGNRVPDANNDGIKTFYRGATLLAASYDEQDRLVSTTYGPMTTEYTYTANGDLLTKDDGTDVTTYTYDVLGNLTRVELPNGDDIDYVIDGRDRRIGKTFNASPGQRLLFVGQLTPVAELDGSNAVVGRFVYASKANVPDYAIRGTTTYRIISDHIGSPRLVIDPSGTVVQRTDYDAFGNILSETVAGGFLRLPFGFGGGIFDSETGLTRFGARDYDPATGRWTTKDPIGFAGGDSDLYAYVLNDPVNAFDPTGRLTAIETAQVGGTIAVIGGIIYTVNRTFPLSSARSVVVDLDAVRRGRFTATPTLPPFTPTVGPDRQALCEKLLEGCAAWCLPRPTGLVQFTQECVLAYHECRDGGNPYWPHLGRRQIDSAW